MTLIAWRDEFELGIDAVDHEHRELIDLINELHAGLESDAPPEAVAAFLGEIYSKISAHFALEETIMRDLKYDEFAAHKEDHEALLDDIRHIMDAYEAGDYVDFEDILSSHLQQWFTEHFRTRDARLHHFLENSH